jgi:hypothetical protein
MFSNDSSGHLKIAFIGSLCDDDYLKFWEEVGSPRDRFRRYFGLCLYYYNLIRLISFSTYFLSPFYILFKIAFPFIYLDHVLMFSLMSY